MLSHILGRSKQETLPDSSQPRAGDMIVTLTCDVDETGLEDRMEVLSYAFVKVVQGAVLRRVTDFDLRNGLVRCIVSEESLRSPVRGIISAHVEPWESVLDFDTDPQLRSVHLDIKPRA